MGRRQHGSRWVAAVVVALASGAGLVVAEPVAADPIEDQRARVGELADQLEALEAASDILAEDYVVAIAEQERLEAEVATAAAQLAEREAEVEALRGELAQVAVRTFMGAGTDGFGLTFDSGSATADLQRDQLSRVALSAGDATTDELDQAVADLDEQRAVLERAEADAADAAEEVESAKAANDEQKTELVDARAAAEDELGRLVQEEEERRARESYERMQREAEAAAAAAAAAQQQADAEAQQAQAAPPDDDSGGDDGGGSSDGGGSGGGGSSDGGGGSSGGGSSSSGGGGQAAAPEPSEPDVPPASSRAGTAVNAAMTQLGVAYQFAKSIPGVAFDCSGLTKWAWAQAGVSLPHQSASQYASIPHVPIDAAQPGDLIFYYSPISHVGIYLGDGQLVHAPNSGSVVKVATVNWGKVTGVGRPG